MAKKKKLEFLKDAGRTMGQAALAYIVAQPAFSSVLLTVTGLAELEEFAGAVDKPLTEEELARIEELWISGFESTGDNEESEVVTTSPS